jgi:hypothetical protein
VVAAFEPQRAVLQTSSAVILDGRTEAGYGVVISADGHILTKASEFEKLKKPAVTVDRTNYEDVKLLAVDPSWDVALLKIEATGLVPVVYAATSEVPQGHLGGGQWRDIPDRPSRAGRHRQREDPRGSGIRWRGAGRGAQREIQSSGNRRGE